MAIYDVTQENFDSVVVEESYKNYVVIDFWAQWCTPCQTLKPILESLSLEYGYTLAKVDTEQNSDLASKFNIGGIPDVRIYKDGKEIDNFSGAQPEEKLREIFEKYMKSVKTLKIEEAVSCENKEDAVAIFNELLKENPKDSEVLMKAGAYLISKEDIEGGKEILNLVPQSSYEYKRAQSILSMLGFNDACKKESDSEVAQLYKEGACLAAGGDLEGALEKFLEVVKRDRKYKDDGGRVAMVTIFENLNDDKLKRLYIKKLSMVLN